MLLQEADIPVADRLAEDRKFAHAGVRRIGSLAHCPAIASRLMTNTHMTCR